MTPNSESDLPHFLCIGAQKAATSWLWVMLRQHPEIWMPPLKEIHFFDHVHVPDNRAWTPGHIRKGVTDALKWHVEHEAIRLDHFKYLVDLALVEPFTESWYRACYDRPGAKGKKLGDITPEYCTLPEEGVSHVKRLLGHDLKLIYVIRNPVDRAISQLKMNLTRKGQESENESFWLESAQDPVLQQRGDYKTYIPRWEKHFPSSNILFLPYKMVQNDPAKLLAAVENHLGVSHFESFAGASEPVHKTRDAKVPSGVVGFLKDILAPQDQYLTKRFGKEFFLQT